MKVGSQGTGLGITKIGLQGVEPGIDVRNLVLGASGRLFRLLSCPSPLPGRPRRPPCSCPPLITLSASLPRCRPPPRRSLIPSTSGRRPGWRRRLLATFFPLFPTPVQHLSPLLHVGRRVKPSSCLRKAGCVTSLDSNIFLGRKNHLSGAAPSRIRRRSRPLPLP